MKQRNTAIFIFGVFLLGVAVFFVGGDILSPYVSFKRARSDAGEYVQVIGKVDKSSPVVYTEGGFVFTVRDKYGTAMKVVHQGIKPQNFDRTEQVVLVGRYILKDEIFVADSVLVKCPSKYRSK